MCQLWTGTSNPPKAMMHSPLFQIYRYFSKNVQTLWKILKILPFPDNFLNFHPPKFLMTFLFLVIDHNPYFPCFSTFPPCFAKIIISPCFAKIIISPLLWKIFLPVFSKIHLLFTYFMCISFPPTLTMMHLCIIQCTYWKPLAMDKNVVIIQ